MPTLGTDKVGRSTMFGFTATTSTALKKYYHHPVVLILMSLFWFIMFVVILILMLVRQEPTRPQLPLLSGINAAMIITATIIIFRSPPQNLRRQHLYTPDIGSWLMFFGFLSIGLQLFIRLVSAKKFGGNFEDFNFGLKCLHPNETSTGDCMNVTFVHEFNSYGHMIQGMLSIFLSPSVHVLLRKCFKKCCSNQLQRKNNIEILLGITDLLPLLTIIYPTYNIIKRSSESASFTVSSFCNNGSEWAVGFLFGLHGGMLCEAIVVRYDMYNMYNNNDSSFITNYNRVNSDTNTNKRTTFISLSSLTLDHGRGSRLMKLVTKYERVLVIVRIVFGLCLFVISIVAGILFGLSWNTTLLSASEEKEQLGESSDICSNSNDCVVWILVTVPVLLLLGASCALGRIFQSLEIKKRESQEVQTPSVALEVVPEVEFNVSNITH